MRTKPLETGIYAIEHIASGRKYIGSAKHFDARWRVHRCLLRKNKHHSPHLQSAWNAHGESSFEFKRLLICSQGHLIDYEQLLIDGFKSFDRKHGFNARALAESSLGHKASDETRKKIKAARAKQVFSAETRALWSKNRTGKKMPDWFGDFIRQTKTGTKHSPEARAKISAAGIGRKASLSTVEKKSKLTLEQVLQIRAIHSSGGISQAQIARDFDLNQSAVSLIVRGKRWANFTNTKEK